MSQYDESFVIQLHPDTFTYVLATRDALLRRLEPDEKDSVDRLLVGVTASSDIAELMNELTGGVHIRDGSFMRLGEKKTLDANVYTIRWALAYVGSVIAVKCHNLPGSTLSRESSGDSTFLISSRSETPVRRSATRLTRKCHSARDRPAGEPIIIVGSTEDEFMIQKITGYPKISLITEKLSHDDTDMLTNVCVLMFDVVSERPRKQSGGCLVT